MPDPLELFKIVRDNYTDCHSGTVKYTIGETLKHPKPRYNLCSDGVYHACRKPEQTVAWRNGQWPLRLLKIITPEIVVEDTDRGDEKCGVHELTVVEELPIVMAFGPNGQKVIDMINRLKDFKWFEPQNKREQVEQLIEKHLDALRKFGAKQVPVKYINDMDAAWDAARDAAWDAARDAAHIVVEDLLDFENPFAPLVEVWELGYWPIGVVNGEFLVFEKK